MSAADVDLVRSLVPDSSVDWAAIVRDEELSGQLEAVVVDLFEPEFGCALVGISEMERSGFPGLLEIWAEWLKPWDTYRVQEERIIDVGDGRVVWLGRDFGGRRDGSGEVVLMSSAIWTIQGGRVVNVVFYADRTQCLAAAGLPSES